MFTLQSGQIENALRTVGVPDVSAREMMSGLANCQAVIEHRGPMALTKPTINYFPTIRPAGPTTNVRFASNAQNTVINIPPWQTVPFTPLPFLPVPPWQTVPYPEWPTTLLEDPTLRVPGPVQLGPVTSPEVTAGDMSTGRLVNKGDLANQGDIIAQGDIRVNSVVANSDLTTQNNVVHNGPVTTNGPVYHNGDTYLNVAHNQYTVNHGPTEHHSEARFDGPTFLHGPNNIFGPTFLRAPVFVNGVPLEAVAVSVVSDLSWDGTVLQKTVKNLRVFGKVLSTTTTTVVDCGV